MSFNPDSQLLNMAMNNVTSRRLTHYLDGLILFGMDSLKNRNCIQSLKVKVITLLVLKGDELLLRMMVASLSSFEFFCT